MCQDADMSQEQTADPVEDPVGYVLKQAATSLRAAMDIALRPLGITVPQYACLTLLGQRPGVSNAELARGAFVTRQSMNAVLRGLQTQGLVSRPATVAQGRALPTQLTPTGRERLEAASSAVNTVEQQMLTHLTADAQHRLRDYLTACVAALTPDTTRGRDPNSDLGE